MATSAQDPLSWSHGSYPDPAAPELTCEGQIGVGQIEEQGWGVGEGSFQTPSTVFLKVQKPGSIASFSVGTDKFLSSLSKELACNSVQ